jgi:alpha-mannosidase
LRKKEAAPSTTSLAVSAQKLENEYFRIAVDPDSGWVKSIVDKRSNREILSGFGNKLQLLEDKPSAWDAWNVGWTGTVYPTTLRSIEIGENGPLAVSLKITRDMLGPSFKRDFPAEGFPSSFFTQEITLMKGIDYVDFKADVDWWEERTMLKVAFPLTIADTMATYEIPYGSIQRSTQSVSSWDKAKKEVAAERWADLSSPEYGVSLLNDSKYGYDIKGSMMRLSILRSPKWPDPLADRGKHSISYALYPHGGTWKDAKTVQRGYEFNYPLIVVAGSSHGGKLPTSHSFMRAEPKNCILASVKKAEDSNAWILQFYESEGKATQARITLPQVPKRVAMTNFLEEEKSVISFNKNSVSVPMKPNQTVTLKVEY